MSNHRRERIRRVLAKRPEPISVEIAYRPSPDARDRLIDLLVELLDERRRSGAT
jgi:hypothetical protein